MASYPSSVIEATASDLKLQVSMPWHPISSTAAVPRRHCSLQKRGCNVQAALDYSFTESARLRSERSVQVICGTVGHTTIVVHMDTINVKAGDALFVLSIFDSVDATFEQ